MTTDIRSLTNELRDFYLQYQQCFEKDPSLTTIQNKANADKRLKQLNASGIKYQVYKPYSFADGSSNPNTRLDIQSPPWQVKDTGIISDVIAHNKFPISMVIGENITIQYLPRKWNDFIKEFFSGSDYINKDELVKIKKGSEYKFKGKILYCYYSFVSTPTNQESFYFQIIGS